MNRPELCRRVREASPAEVSAALCSRSLAYFLPAAWPHIRGDAEPFVPAWHIEAIAEHLEALSAGEIRRLLINIPPRFTKTLTISVCFPAWEWANRPGTKFLCASYAKDLALRDAVSMRTLCISQWYRDRWGLKWQFADDSNEKGRFVNNRGGHRFSTGVEGQILGEGGDILIVDDPHNVTTVQSKVELKKTRIWFHEGFLTRFNNAKTGRCAVIGQRVAGDDLSAELTDDPHWEKLILPNEYDPKRSTVTSIGFHDPREPGAATKYTERFTIEQGPGSLLCPQRFGEQETIHAKSPSGLGRIGYAAQFQQLPVPRGGAFFTESEISRCEWRADYLRLLPYAGGERAIHLKELGIFIVADTASTEDTQADATAIGVFAATSEGDLALLDLDHGRYEIPEVRSRIAAKAAEWRTQVIAVEYASTGIGIVQDLRADPRFVVIPVMVNQEVQKLPGVKLKISDKVGRASLAQIQFEGGRYFLPHKHAAAWVQTCEDEMLAFSPDLTHAHDDIVDILGYAVILRLNGVFDSCLVSNSIRGSGEGFRPEAFF